MEPVMMFWLQSCDVTLSRSRHRSFCAQSSRTRSDAPLYSQHCRGVTTSRTTRNEGRGYELTSSHCEYRRIFLTSSRAQVECSLTSSVSRSLGSERRRVLERLAQDT